MHINISTGELLKIGTCSILGTCTGEVVRTIVEVTTENLVADSLDDSAVPYSHRFAGYVTVELLTAVMTAAQLYKAFSNMEKGFDIVFGRD